jgi:hypothetical protein
MLALELGPLVVMRYRAMPRRRPNPVLSSQGANDAWFQEVDCGCAVAKWKKSGGAIKLTLFRHLLCRANIDL